MQQVQVPKVSVSNSVLNWLLEEDEPSARYHALVDLQERSPNDQSVVSTKNRIGKVGWASKILAKQKENTYWDNPRSCYVPKFSACSWQLVVLADLGVSSKDQRVDKAVDHFLEHHNVETGGISLRPKGHEKFEPHICATGNMVRALAKMGYAEDDRDLSAMDWLLSKQLADGGWDCSPSGKHGSFMSVIQPVWAPSEMMAHVPRQGWAVSANRRA